MRLLALVSLMALSGCGGPHNGHGQGHHRASNTDTTVTNIEKPRRITHRAVQEIRGTLEEIMPLYCPVRELDWCEYWAPKAVYSNSGLVEKNCIFTTSHGEYDVVWIVTDYDVEAGRVEMVYHVPNVLVTLLEIQLTPINGHTARAEITYTKTAISEEGIKALEEFTKESYDQTMDSWEKAMNHYLETGEMLTGLPW